MSRATVHSVHFTDRSIKALRGGQCRRDYMCPGSKVRGFGIRVTPNGAKTFFIRYKRATGWRRFVVGRYPELDLATARSLAEEAVGRLARGEDPQGELAEQRRAAQFEQLVDLYLESYARPRMKERSFAEEARVIHHDLLPAWRRHPVAEIRRRDVAALIAGIRDRGAPVQANRTRSVAMRIFAFAVEREMIEHNPVLGLRPPTRERSRDRVLSATEIRSLWALWEDEDSAISALFRLLLLTGRRIGEMRQMEWSEIDDAWWTIPQEKSKNRRAQLVFLTDAARTVLAEERARAEEKHQISRWVFPSPSTDTHIVAESTAMARFRKHSRVFGWTPHDLRRTAATGMGDLGVSDGVIGLVLGHIPRGVIARYSRSQREQEIRAALDEWATRLVSIVTGPV